MNAWNPDRDRHGRFMPGSGGRPLGSCNRTARRVREALAMSLDLHLGDVLEEVRRRDPTAWLRLVLRAAPPTRMDVGAIDELTPEQLADRLSDFAAWLAAAGYGPWAEDDTEGACEAGQVAPGR